MGDDATRAAETSQSRTLVMLQHGHPLVPARATGSVEDFESDWNTALGTGDTRWLVYPSPDARDQVSVAEWVKAEQVVAILRERRHAGWRKHRPVLEYGCGAAGMSIYLRQRGYRCISLDRSEAALRVARLNQRRHDPHGPPQILVVGDAAALPFGRESFGVVMSYGLLEHFAEPALGHVLRECIGALEVGGVFVADIVPGRLNVRSLGIALSFAGSALLHIVRGRWRHLGRLWASYFHRYFENAYGPTDWAAKLMESGLADVRVRVCRPFPPLAISGRAERLYVTLMRWCLPLWHRFDQRDSRVTRAWGWMYLCSGIKRAAARLAGDTTS